MAEQPAVVNSSGKPVRLLLVSSMSWKVVAVVVWLTFSVALALWWLIFGLNQIDRISEIARQVPNEVTTRLAHEIARQHRMLMSEGATLILMLLGGGAALLYHINTEMARARKLREFFAAFTHDLKTSLASLRLQAESLEEDLRESGQERLMRRLVKDTVRLELQLENSLLLASPEDSSRFLLEPIQISDVLVGMKHHWPELQLEIDGDGLIRADQRAVESIFKNLLQNSVIHGRATKISIRVERNGTFVTVRLADNGRGFRGDRTRLGKMFERHGTSSGSGLGLYLASDLSQRMGGELRFCETSEGFCVEILFPQEKASSTVSIETPDRAMKEQAKDKTR